jgi:predicted HicB family RNase H-like nuclease
MASVLTYKGYIGKVELDEEENELHGRVINTRDMITFVGRTVQEAKRALKESVDAHLAFCAAQGIEPGKPYSGKILLRVAPELHAAVVAQAAIEDQSLNEYLKSLLERAAAREPTTGKHRKRRARAA